MPITTETVLINPENGSTVPPAQPAPNRQNRRKGPSKLKPVKRELTPEQSLHQLRARVFSAAHETLTIVKALDEATSCMHPSKPELNEALKVVQDAYISAGLELVRPIVANLKRFESLKLVEPAADTLGNEAQSTVAT